MKTVDELIQAAIEAAQSIPVNEAALARHLAAHPDEREDEVRAFLGAGSVVRALMRHVAHCRAEHFERFFDTAESAAAAMPPSEVKADFLRDLLEHRMRHDKVVASNA